ncbi:unnamed protein product (macronuclear) [Paramecium tetraurelia]|uniref:Uncharacterized protein n=1 Tax=Paramecium tetraurelia TaxID=5888 RepID=A0BYX9_PARTE|nr:uncharacterized protein GSPATT00033599001 [Paramecium tetraurelia]CAK63746.1 unnamed protein product [Paramecium tetraurelia]|eukprot:XP_001431144.1 hypothetical protein (macronuclear) [Paramecium tetraurelia strain d4-2]
MGNNPQQQFQNQQYDDEWEILEIEKPKKILNLRQSTLNKSIFTVIDYQEPSQNKAKPLFSGNHPEKQTTKYQISKRIQELQHKIGGETLFGVRKGHGPIQLGVEGQSEQKLEDRPQFPRKHKRAEVKFANLQLD